MRQIGDNDRIGYNQLAQNDEDESDIEIYNYILAKQDEKLVGESSTEAACLTHIIFKIVVVIFVYSKPFVTKFIQEVVYYQIIFFFTVVDFWFTKNYSGRKLIGASWYFEQDINGSERFQFQYRVNDHYHPGNNVRIFWMTNIVYVLFLALYFFAQGLEYDLDTSRLYLFQLISFAIALTAINGLLFYKARANGARKKLLLKQNLPINYLSKFGNNSIVSYF